MQNWLCWKSKNYKHHEHYRVGGDHLAVAQYYPCRCIKIQVEKNKY